MNVVYPCSCSLSKQQQELQWRVCVHWQSSKGRAMYVFIFWSEHQWATFTNAIAFLQNYCLCQNNARKEIYPQTINIRKVAKCPTQGHNASQTLLLQDKRSQRAEARKAVPCACIKDHDLPNPVWWITGGTMEKKGKEKRRRKRGKTGQTFPAASSPAKQISPPPLETCSYTTLKESCQHLSVGQASLVQTFLKRSFIQIFALLE